MNRTVTSNQLTHRAPVVLGCCAVLLAVFPVALQAQQGSRATIGGLQHTLPVVPRQNARPGQGPGEDEKWRIARPEGENAPSASFIDSLKGNDTAFQITVGQGRLMTTRNPIATEDGVAVIAVGDPSVIDFDVLPNPRMIRVIGKRAGVTDLSITTTDDQVYSFEVHVGYDLTLLRAQLAQVFPDAVLQLGQIREHLVVEGQARSGEQVSQIVQTIQGYLNSVQVPLLLTSSQGGAPAPRYMEMGPDGTRDTGEEDDAGVTFDEYGGRPDTGAEMATAQIINLIRVPGVQQVMLKCRVAELDRNAVREVGLDAIVADGNTFFSTILGNAMDSTIFAVFDAGDVDLAIKLLRRNSVATILAEPNLIAMSGQQASFLAGGEFPVPVPQTLGDGGNSTVTVEFKPFGVQLSFIPYVLDDELVRLVVAPEVSTIDETLSTTLVQGGDPVPGTRNRRAQTTVELRQGQTLAIAGLINTELDAGTTRIPLLGDLPYVGPLFSNTSHQRFEQELLVLVTPYLVHPMDPHQVGPGPGTEVTDPDDKEFYFLNRIEGCRGGGYRATTGWDRPLQRQHERELQRHTYGPVGFSR